MNPIDYLRALRRRWVTVVSAGAIAVLLAGLLTINNIGPVTPSYQATAMMLKAGWSGSPIDTIRLETVTALVSVGEVPARVAEEIGYEGDPSALATQVEAEVEEQSGLLLVTATSSDPGEAKRISDAFANELIGFLDDQKTELFLQESETVVNEMEELKTEAAALEDRIDRAPDNQQGVLSAERDALIRRYGFLYERYRQLAVGPASPGTFTVIARGDPIPAVSEGIQAPQTSLSWMVLAGILGLLVGAGVALVLDRFDTRIRTKEAAERHFRLPVLTEIPLMRRWVGRPEVTITSSKSPSAESFRLLSTGLTYLAGSGNGDASAGGIRQKDEPLTIVVTSPGPNDGKTTVVANLAATFGELGKKVLILSCDFRRPKIHKLFGVPNKVGLADSLAESNGRVLEGHVHQTGVPGVSMVPSGEAPDKPSELLGSSHMARALDEARALADVVLVDTAPILVANDVMHLLGPPFRVLVVARAGKTDAEHAERTSELLDRVGASVIGVALNGVTEALVARRYYRYYRYYGEKYDGRRKGIPGLLRQSKGR